MNKKNHSHGAGKVSGTKVCFALVAMALMAMTAFVAVAPVSSTGEMTEGYIDGKYTGTIDLSDGLGDDEMNALIEEHGSVSFENDVLTIEGIDFVTTAAVAIKCDHGFEIEVIGKNRITAENTKDNGKAESYGILVSTEGKKFHLRIHGTGELSVYSGKADARSYAINNKSDGSIQIYGGVTINAYGNESHYSKGLIANFLRISEPATTVLAQGSDINAAKDKATSYGLHASTRLEIDRANVTARGGNITGADIEDAQSIGAFAQQLIFYGATLEFMSGDAPVGGHRVYSLGLWIYLENSIIIDSTITAVSGAATTSYGLYLSPDDEVSLSMINSTLVKVKGNNGAIGINGQHFTIDSTDNLEVSNDGRNYHKLTSIDDLSSHKYVRSITGDTAYDYTPVFVFGFLFAILILIGVACFYYDNPNKGSKR